MREMLENRTFLRKQMLDNWFAVALIAAPKATLQTGKDGREPTKFNLRTVRTVPLVDDDDTVRQALAHQLAGTTTSTGFAPMQLRTMSGCRQRNWWLAPALLQRGRSGRCRQSFAPMTRQYMAQTRA